MMMTPEAIQKILTERLPGAEVTVEDMTGTADHWQIQVMWNGFKGKPLMAQHKMVNQALSAELENGSIHAVKIKTYALD